MSSQDEWDQRKAGHEQPAAAEEGSYEDRPSGRHGGTPARSAVSRGRRLIQRLGVPLVVLIVVAVLFAFQNLTRVTISFWTIKIVSPLWISLYFWLIVGGVIGYVAGRAVERRPKRRS